MVALPLPDLPEALSELRDLAPCVFADGRLYLRGRKALYCIR